MIKTDIIKLSNLLVNPENYRFEPVEHQKEAIDMMVDDQQEKLFALAADINEFGLNPNKRVQVTPSNHDKTKYIILEGNRRVVTLKSLNNPDLINKTKYARLNKKFKQLHDKDPSKLIQEVECVIYDSPAEADRWIKLEHAGEQGGIGVVGWNSLQVSRFEEKVEGKSPIALQTLNLLKNSPIVSSEIKDKLENISITNLERLISDPNVRQFLGIEIKDGKLQSEIDIVEVIKGLTKLVKDLLTPGFIVKKIYTKEDRGEYINNFSKQDRPDIHKKAPTAWQFNEVVGKAGSSKKSKPKPQHRNKLIPHDCILKIKNNRINKIYYELSKIDITKYTNAAAVLFRVFIELSLDYFMEENNIIHSGASAAKSNISLEDKVIKVAGYLESNKKADTAICKGVKVATQDKNSILGIDTWHAYVHNNKFSPDPQILINTWDNIQSFIKILWENIK